MSQGTRNTFHTVCMAVGVFLLTTLVVVGGTVLYQNRNASIDLSPSAWFSQEDLDTLKDPEAARKADQDKFSREAWDHYQKQQPQQQPQNGWNQGWKK